MNRILVTGASGMIGQGLCRRLASSGVDVVRAGRATSDDVNWNAGESLCEPLAGVDAIVHLAARVHVRGKGYADRAAFEEINAKATLQLARDAAEAGVQRFVFLSSIGVLGSVSSTPFREDDPPQPHTAYTASKRAAEDGLRACNGIECVILRPPAVIGSGARGNVASLVAAIRRGLPLPFASVTNARHYVSLENLLDAVLLALEQPAAAGEIFHVANPERVSTADLCRSIAAELAVSPRLWPFPPAVLRTLLSMAGRHSLADGLLADLLVDTGKIHAVLGWSPRQSLGAAIRQAVEELR